ELARVVPRVEGLWRTFQAQFQHGERGHAQRQQQDRRGDETHPTGASCFAHGSLVPHAKTAGAACRKPPTRWRSGEVASARIVTPLLPSTCATEATSPPWPASVAKLSTLSSSGKAWHSESRLQRVSWSPS